MKPYAFEGRKVIHRGVRTTVLRAHRRSDGARVILKTPSIELPTPGELQRLRFELEVGRAVDGCGGLRYLGVEPFGNSVALVMEDFGAISLNAARGASSVEEWLTLARAVTARLAAMNARGFTHGALCPAHILVGDGGRLALCDLGDAAPLDGARRFPRTFTAVHYLAPERTGRTDRAVDHRADLYSLGVTLFELLVGRPPFDSRDPLHVLHAHLAKAAPRASSVRAEVPPGVDALLARLLAKDPDHRYQTTAGMLHDLTQLAGSAGARGVPEIQLAGEGDVGSVLTFPNRVFGREAHVARLLETFGMVRPGAPQFALVRGPSGIGKTSVAQELSAALLARRAYLCRGKFDELRRGVPYSAIFEAARGFLRGVLADTAEEVAAWRERLREAVGSNGSLLMDGLPELGRLLPSEPLLGALPQVERQVRFVRTLERLVAALSTPERPLVLFLDDLQWADDGSLRLIESLAASSFANVMVLGAYRESEVSAGHPLLLTLASIEKQRPVTTIDVGPLEPSATEALLRAALRRDGVGPLAALIQRKTGGNPFFVRQFLTMIRREGLLTFDLGGGAWSWDVDAIEGHGFTDNVVALMVVELRTLAPEEQRVLSLAAAIGATFEVATLAAVAGVSLDVAELCLEAPVRRSFVRPAGERYDTCTFTHDRIREAAYDLIPPEARPSVHLDVGRPMLDADPSLERLFDVVGHLNRGRALISEAAERSRLVDLNLRAAHAARSASAWTTAIGHLDIARELLGEHAHRRDYARWLELHTTYAATSCLLADDARTERAIETILAGARTASDRLAAFRVRLLMLLGRNRLAEAVALAKDLLRLLGIDLSPRTRTHQALAAIARIKWRLRGHTAESLAALPRMTEPKALMALEIMSSVLTSTFMAEPLFFPVLVAEMLRLTLDRGAAVVSPEVIALCGMLSMAALRDLEDARRLVDAAHAMIEPCDALHKRHRVLMVEAIFVSPWTRPLHECVDSLMECHRTGMDAGDIEYASVAMSTSCFYAMMVGQPLEELDAALVGHFGALRRAGMFSMIADVRRQLQFVRNLRGASRDPERMVSDEFDEVEDLRVQTAGGHKNSISALAWYQGMLALYHRSLPRACERADAAMAELSAHQGTQMTPRIWHLHAIAHLQLGHTGRSREALKVLRAFEKRAPSTFGHLADLVAAERARVGGRTEEAARLYDDAVERASAAGCLQDAGLAAELAARFWRARGVESVARPYLVQARHFYLTWGALAKVAQLDREEEGGGHGAAISTRAPPHGGGVEALDLVAALRASNAIAAERTLEGVTQRVLSALVGDAGAERATLLLVGAEGSVRVVAESSTRRGFLAIDRPLEAYPALPERVVRFVQRSRVPVVLGDAARVGEFIDDPYVRSSACKSLMCAPVTRQGDLLGLVYLENNLSLGAFGRGRLDLVTMLAAQAAISIVNAELNETLERRVRERTDELALRNRFIRETFGRYVSDDVVDSLLASPEGLALGGQTRQVTILMSDLRGFSSLSERIRPEQVVRLLNTFLSEMTDVILRYRGTIDEFIGDAILVIFGAPVASADDADRAIACAIEMQQAMARVNATNEAAGLPSVEMGIGLNTGEVVVGNIGSDRRAKYGVVGRAVNLTGRIESYTVGGQVLASEATVRAASSPVRIVGRFQVRPKGVSSPLTLMDVHGIGGPYGVSLGREPDEAFESLEHAEPFVYWELVGKDSPGPSRRGSLRAISQRGALVRLEAPLPPRAELRLELSGSAAPAAELYARVLPTALRVDGLTALRFTALAVELRDHLRSLRGPSMVPPTGSPPAQHAASDTREGGPGGPRAPDLE